MNNTFGDLHVLTGYIQNLITLWMYVDKFVKLFKHNVIAHSTCSTPACVLVIRHTVREHLASSEKQV